MNKTDESGCAVICLGGLAYFALLGFKAIGVLPWSWFATISAPVWVPVATAGAMALGFLAFLLTLAAVAVIVIIILAFVTWVLEIK